MLAMRTGPVTVLAVRVKQKRAKVEGSWQEVGPATRRDGTQIHEILVQVDGEEAPRKWDVAEGVNVAALPASGETVELALTSRMWLTARTGNDGRPYPTRINLESVTEVYKVKSTDKAAAAA